MTALEETVSEIQITDKHNVGQRRTHLRLQPSKGWAPLRLRELWEYRELLFFLTWRDIQVRYKQTVLGVAWAIIQPFMTMVVFTLFFGGLARIPSDGVPYPVWSYAALVPWTLFANGLTMSSNSLVGNANLIKKVYFPRLTIPISTVLSGVVDFVLAFVVLLIMMLFFGIVPTINIIFLPYFILLAFVTSLGVGLWLSAMNVQFRDVRYTVPFLTQLWLFITPIAYPSSLIENDVLRSIYGLNPMAGVVEGFRWALLGTGSEADVVLVAITTVVSDLQWGARSISQEPDYILFVSSIAAFSLLISGLFYFRRMEKSFADVV